MGPTSFDKARFLICCVVFLEFKLQVQASRVNRETKCPPGTYPSTQLYGGCAQCPETCEIEKESDKDPCRKACEKKIVTPSTPVIDSTPKIHRNAKPSRGIMSSTKTAAKQTVEQQLSDTDQIVILVGIPAIVVLIAIVVIVILCRRSDTQATQRPPKTDSPEETVTISVSDPVETGESARTSIGSLSEAEIAEALKANLRLFDDMKYPSDSCLSRETVI